MQTIKTIALALFMGIAAFGMTLGSAQATLIFTPVGDVTLISDGGQLIGAQNVDVGGTLFDVEFLEGSCAVIYDGCTDPEDFAFTNEDDALAAADALLFQVFVDVFEGLQFDTDPTLTLGCSFDFGCSAIIPYASPAPTVILAALAGNAPPPFLDGTGLIIFVGPDVRTDFSDFESTANVFALFSPTGVPEPATLVLFGVGLLGLAGMRRRRPRR